MVLNIFFFDQHHIHLLDHTSRNGKRTKKNHSNWHIFFTSLSSTRAAITTTTTKKCTNSRLMKKSSPKNDIYHSQMPHKKVMYVTNQKKKKIDSRFTSCLIRCKFFFCLKFCTKMRLHHSHDDYSTSRMMVVMNDQLMVNWGILIEKLFWNFFLVLASCDAVY